MSTSTSPSGPLLTATNPANFEAFAKYLRGYMGVMPLVTAAFAPLLTVAHVIPIYAQQAKSLACMSGLLGFLGVAWVFYARHSLGALLFGTPSVDYVHLGDRLVASLRSTGMMAAPLLLILLSVFCYFRYNTVLEDSIAAAQAQAVLRAHVLDVANRDPRSLLAMAPVDLIPKRAVTLAQIDYEIPYGGVLAMLYLGIFLCAELAFVLMATREYLQSLMRRTDEQIIYGLQGRSVPPITT